MNSLLFVDFMKKYQRSSVFFFLRCRTFNQFNSIAGDDARFSAKEILTHMGYQKFGPLNGLRLFGTALIMLIIQPFFALFSIIDPGQLPKDRYLSVPTPVILLEQMKKKHILPHWTWRRDVRREWYLSYTNYPNDEDVLSMAEVRRVALPRIWLWRLEKAGCLVNSTS